MAEAQLSYSRARVEVQCTVADCRGVLWKRSVRSDGSRDIDRAIEIAKHHTIKEGHGTLVRSNEEIIIRRTDG